jgi:hypothetical protein
MPELITFRGRPVKRRVRVAGGLRLILVSAIPGRVGEQLNVSEADWREHGHIEFFTRENLPDVRALAARTS